MPSYGRSFLIGSFLTGVFWLASLPVSVSQAENSGFQEEFQAEKNPPIQSPVHAPVKTVSPDLQNRTVWQEDIDRILAYLNTLKTLTASFQQFSDDGSHTQGRLYLKRPGRLRIEYDPPPPLLILADGKYLFYYDTELNSLSQFSLDETPAGILLDEKIDLTKGRWTPTDLKTGPGSLRLTLSDRQGIQLTLIFSDSPLSLRKWRILDAQGIETTLVLGDIRQGESLPEDLFILENPQAFTNPFIR